MYTLPCESIPSFDAFLCEVNEMKCFVSELYTEEWMIKLSCNTLFMYVCLSISKFPYTFISLMWDNNIDFLKMFKFPVGWVILRCDDITEKIDFLENLMGYGILELGTFESKKLVKKWCTSVRKSSCERNNWLKHISIRGRRTGKAEYQTSVNTWDLLVFQSCAC